MADIAVYGKEEWIRIRVGFNTDNMETNVKT